MKLDIVGMIYLITVVMAFITGTLNNEYGKLYKKRKGYKCDSNLYITISEWIFFIIFCLIPVLNIAVIRITMEENIKTIEKRKDEGFYYIDTDEAVNMNIGTIKQFKNISMSCCGEKTIYLSHSSNFEKQEQTVKHRCRKCQQEFEITL